MRDLAQLASQRSLMGCESRYLAACRCPETQGLSQCQTRRPGVGERAPGTWACLGSVVAERGLSGTYKWTMSERTPDPLSPPISSRSPWLPGCLFFFFFAKPGWGERISQGRFEVIGTLISRLSGLRLLSPLTWDL